MFANEWRIGTLYPGELIHVLFSYQQKTLRLPSRAIAEAS